MAKLSKREKEVLELLLTGHLQKQIASTLGISISRIQDIKGIIKKKWGVNTEVDFILYALNHGYLKRNEASPDEIISYVVHSTIGCDFFYSYTSSKYDGAS